MKIKGRDPTLQLCKDDFVESRTTVIGEVGEIEMIEIFIHCDGVLTCLNHLPASEVVAEELCQGGNEGQYRQKKRCLGKRISHFIFFNTTMTGHPRYCTIC